MIHHSLTLCLKTTEFRQIPRAWTSFFVQTLEATSNQSQLIMKRCLGLLALLRGELINLGLLIAESINYMGNVAQKACGHFFVL